MRSAVAESVLILNRQCLVFIAFFFPEAGLCTKCGFLKVARVLTPVRGRQHEGPSINT